MKEIRLRKVVIGDSTDIFDWLNDGETIMSRFSSRPVTREEHEKWFKAALSDPNRTLYLAEDAEGNKIGVVRLDKLSDKVVEYDINVAPAMRGKGYGQKMIDLAFKIYSADYPVHLFIARIKKANLRSKAAFQKAGCFPLFAYCDKDLGEIEVLGKIRP